MASPPDRTIERSVLTPALAWFRSPGFLIFLIGFCVTLLLIPSPGCMVTDSTVRFDEAHALWTGVPMRLGIPGRGGFRHGWHGAGQTLLMIPFDMALTLIGRVPESFGFVALSYVFFPLLNGISVWVCFRLLLSFFRPWEATAGTLGLMFASSFLWHLQNNQENPLQLALTAAAMALAIRYGHTSQPRWLVIGAMVGGYALLIRLPAIVEIACTCAIPVLMVFFDVHRTAGERHARLRSIVIDLTKYALPVYAGYLLMDRLYHFYRFGTIYGTYISLYCRHFFPPIAGLGVDYVYAKEWLPGFIGPFLFPGKSVFLYDPLILLTLVLAVGHWRRLQPALKSLMVCCVVMLVGLAAGYAGFFTWTSGPAWGDRYVAVPCHLLALLSIPLALTLRLFSNRWIRWILTTFLLVCCLDAVASVTYSVWLEDIQDYDHYIGWEGGRCFKLGERWTNIAGSLTGNFENWGLNRCRGGEIIAPYPPMLVPFLPLETLSRPAAAVLKVLWWSVFLGVLALIGAVIRSTSHAH